MPQIFGIGNCYSWEKSCTAPQDPCNAAQFEQTSCPDTQTWFWLLLGAGVVVALVAAGSKKK